MKAIYQSTTAATTQPITERVKTFEDACRELGISKIELGITGMDEDQESIEAYAKLIIIARALNEGWQPDWSDQSQYKYVPWFEHKSGFGLSYDGCDRWYSHTTVGSRLCYKSRQLAEYAGKQFADIYNQYLSIKPTQK